MRRRCSPSPLCAMRWAANTAARAWSWTVPRTTLLWSTGGTAPSSCGASSRPESSAAWILQSRSLDASPALAISELAAAPALSFLSSSSSSRVRAVRLLHAPVCSRGSPTYAVRAYGAGTVTPQSLEHHLSKEGPRHARTETRTTAESHSNIDCIRFVA